MPRLDPVGQYEVTQIWSPDLSAEEQRQYLEEFNAFLTENGCEIVNQEIWGLRRLAYPIRKKESGYYVYTEFRARASFIAQLRRYLQLRSYVMRELIVKLDKHAIEFNRRRQEKMRTQTSAGI
ncbi:MAG: 30S ribosomal protein S6 [Bacteroidia bacterium]|nr:30S ribosomal protein S6 [Bacteroidia bacterium]MCX7764577.1 30S ribosomal protein S6 [Bacteroidia bacterium]MDW8056812.1 30S ribosomal protein S6 [Bacteroidia bacterium]